MAAITATVTGSSKHSISSSKMNAAAVVFNHSLVIPHISNDIPIRISDRIDGTHNKSELVALLVACSVGVKVMASEITIKSLSSYIVNGITSKSSRKASVNALLWQNFDLFEIHQDQSYVLFKEESKTEDNVECDK